MRFLIQDGDIETHQFSAQTPSDRSKILANSFDMDFKVFMIYTNFFRTMAEFFDPNEMQLLIAIFSLPSLPTLET